MQRNPLGLTLFLVLLLGGAAAWLFSTSGTTTPVPTGPAPAAGDAAPSGGEAIPEAEDPGASEATPETNPEPSREVVQAQDASTSLAAWDVAADGEAMVVSGVVVDQAGRPVPGASIQGFNPALPEGAGNLPINVSFGGLEELQAMDRPAAVADAEGRFRVSLEETGKFILLASHPDHPQGRFEGSHDGDGERVGIRIELPMGGSIRGSLQGIPAEHGELRVFASRVKESGVDPDGGALGSGGVRIELDSLVGDLGGITSERTAGVAEDGSFELRGLALNATYKVFAMHDLSGEGFGADRGEGTRQARAMRLMGMNSALKERCSTVAEVLPGGTALLRWQQGTTLTFQVVDAESGAPLEDLKVRAGVERTVMIFGVEAPMAQTRSLDQRMFPDGLVTVPGLDLEDDVGKVRIKVEAPGYQPHEQEGIEIDRGTTRDLGVIQMQPAAGVLVTVVDSASGEPIAGAQVALLGPGDEEFDFEALQEQFAPGAGESEATRSFSMGFNIGASGGLGTSTSFETSSGDRPSRRARGTTDDDGTCRLEWGKGPEVVVRVRADAHAPHRSAALTLPAGGGTLRHTVRMLTGGTLDVRVLDPEGRPLADRNIVHREPGGPRMGREIGTDANGVVTLEHLSPGIHKVRLQDSGQQEGGMVFITAIDRMQDDGWTEVEVRDRTRHSVDLMEQPKATVRGTVTADGLPLEGARVTLLEGSGSGEDGEDIARSMATGLLSTLGGGGEKGKTNSTGAFELTGQPVGEHRLKVSHPDLAMPAEFPVQLLPGDNIVQLPVTISVLRGIVQDASGQPIRGAEVSVFANDSSALGITSMISLEGDGGPFGAMLSGNRKPSTTEADGRFELRGVAHGKALKLRIKAQQQTTKEVDVDALKEGETREIGPIAMQPGGILEVRASGVGMAAAVIVRRLDDPDGSEQKTAILMGGKATLKGLTPGRWEVSVRTQRNDGRLAPQEVEVLAGQTATVRFDG